MYLEFLSMRLKDEMRAATETVSLESDFPLSVQSCWPSNSPTFSLSPNYIISNHGILELFNSC